MYYRDLNQTHMLLSVHSCIRVQHVIDLDYAISQRTKYHCYCQEALEKCVGYRRCFI